MSKQSGLGDNAYVDGVDLSGDTGSLGAIGGGPALLEVTGIDKSGFERLGGVRDGRIDWSSWFNPTNAHAELSTLPITNRIVTYCRGTALGNPAACLVGKQVNYDPTRNADGSLTIALNAQANGFGIEWGTLLTAGIRDDTAPTNGAGVNLGVQASNFGGQAYLHVFEFTGTDATVTVQRSDDDGAVDPYEDVPTISFAPITSGPGSQRAQSNGDITFGPWLRVITETVGGFTSLSFAVVIVRNQVAVTF